jgi:hypothetical protein
MVGDHPSDPLARKLSTSSVDVVPEQVVTLTIGIQDVSDYIYDSAVYIEAFSLVNKISDEPTNAPIGSTPTVEPTVVPNLWAEEKVSFDERSGGLRRRGANNQQQQQR